jgi:hypothetical protein
VCSERCVPKGVFLLVVRSPPKWLHIILDINGILCYCMEKAATNKMPFVNDVKQGIHSSIIPTIVGPKAIFTCLRLLKFFTAINRTTVEEIVDYLFRGLPLPYEILGHDKRRKIETSWDKYLKVICGSKH